jgi:hypothetical protein
MEAHPLPLQRLPRLGGALKPPRLHLQPVILGAIGLALLTGSGLAQALPGAESTRPAPSPHGPLAIDCAACHGTADWRLRPDADFDHDRQTTWPLVGAHRQADCRACHLGDRFAGTARDCAACHQDLHEGALGADCEQCHSTGRWFDRSRMLDLHAGTSLPLAGAHLAADCGACHSKAPAGDFALASDCSACHLDGWLASGDPDHAAAGFSLDCRLCHDDRGWRPAAFDHAGTAFPLTGAHRGLACALCHDAGQYTGTPTACSFCHLEDWEQARDPDHQAAGFPLSCDDCHSTATWNEAVFDHDLRWFPIYSGEHRNEWSSCADCHLDSGDFGRFSCIHCHEHARPEMDDEHEDVPDYVWESQACLACHPDGTKNDSRTLPRLRHGGPDGQARPRLR